MVAASAEASSLARAVKPPCTHIFFVAGRMKCSVEWQSWQWPGTWYRQYKEPCMDQLLATHGVSSGSFHGGHP